MKTSSLTGSKPARRYDLDWLRMLAILAVFLYHSARFFDLEDWNVKNATTYFGVEVVKMFVALWGMPLIFVISGASTFYALRPHGAGKFVKDRALRLLVPLIAGIFTHVMVQVYVERVSHGQFSGTFFEFIPHYFNGLYGFGGNLAWMGLRLWYLEILFVFSVLLLPLFQWLKHGAGRRVLRGLAEFSAKPLAVYVLALPIIVLLSAIDPDSFIGLLEIGNWRLVIYIVFFGYGFVLTAHEDVSQMIKRQRWLSSIVGAILFLVLGAM